ARLPRRLDRPRRRAQRGRRARRDGEKAPTRPHGDGSAGSAALKRPEAKRPERSKAAAPPGEVRIIGGQWKRTRLPVAPVEGLRPTPDRVRETLFNWLGQDL